MTSPNGLSRQGSRKRGSIAGTPEVPAPVTGLDERQETRTPRDPSARGGEFKIKSYYARTVEGALAQAREEMGPEAVLVHSRKTPLESRHLGPYEVVFSHPGQGAHPAHGSEGIGSAGLTARSREMQHDHSLSALANQSLSCELMQMRRQMEEIRKALALRPVSETEPPREATVESIARECLLGAGLEEEVATEVVRAASGELQQLEGGTSSSTSVDAEAPPLSRIHAVLEHTLVGQMPCAPAVRARESTADVVAFLGPPGAGKTTSLIKLALLTGQGSARPVHLISADSYRIGASEQIRTFASILGVSIDFVDSPHATAQAIEANRHKERILIDTPGLSGSDFELLDDLASYLGSRNDIVKHLVLPATMRFKDMQRCIAQYARFDANRLLFTHLDETDSFGPLYCASVWSGKPISYLSAGQQIPEDFEEATGIRIPGLLLAAQRERVAA